MCACCAPRHVSRRWLQLRQLGPSHDGERVFRRAASTAAQPVVVARSPTRRRGRPWPEQASTDLWEQPEWRLERNESERELSSALAELPRSQRQALTLHYLEDRRYDEIAATMGVPLNTVKSHILRGKERLAALLGGRRPARFGSRGRGVTVKVLLADDDPHVRSALRLLLENESGVAIVGEWAAADGLVDEVLRTQASVVLLDWGLPGLNAERRRPPPGGLPRLPPAGAQRSARAAGRGAAGGCGRVRQQGRRARKPASGAARALTRLSSARRSGRELAQAEPGQEPEGDAGRPEALEIVEHGVQQPRAQAGEQRRPPRPLCGRLTAAHAVDGRRASGGPAARPARAGRATPVSASASRYWSWAWMPRLSAGTPV